MCSSTSDTFADSYLSLIFLSGCHLCSHWTPHHYLDQFLRVNGRECPRSWSEVAWSGTFLLLLLLLLWWLLLMESWLGGCPEAAGSVWIQYFRLQSGDRVRRSPLGLLSVRRSLNPTANTASIEFHKFRCHGNEHASCLFLKGRRTNAVPKANTCSTGINNRLHLLIIKSSTFSY